MLGQAFWTLETDPAVDTDGADLYAGVGDSLARFRAEYAEWTGAGGAAALEQLAAEALASRTTLGIERQRRASAGDLDGARALDDAIAQADQLQADLRAAQDTASQYARTWDTLASWAATVSDTFGLGVLPLIPLGLTVAAAVAAIAALSSVIASWHTAQTKTALVTDLANRLAAGTLTTPQVEALTGAIKDADSSWFSGLGTVGLVAAGVAAFLFLRR